MLSSHRILALLMAVFCISSLASPAQSALPLPGCEAVPEVRKGMDEKLDSTLLDKMKFAERVAYERKLLEDWMTRYPREIQPVLRYLTVLNQYAPEDYGTYRDGLVKAAKEHPDDPLALLLAGKALVGKDTPEALKLMEAAKAKAPQFAWADLYLASAYSTGKRVDPAKTKEDLEAFFAICPASTDSGAQWLLNKDQPLQPKVAEALRARLAAETDPKRLEDYTTLWGLEFRTHPPNQHDAVRAQVAQDLKRLEALNPHGNAEWEAFLVTGYKESGAGKDVVTAKEDRVIHDYPQSDEAYEIVSDRWTKAHKDPEDHTDAAAWKQHRKEYEEAVKGWIHDYPDNAELQRDEWFYAIQSDDAIQEKEGIAALDAYLEAVHAYVPPNFYSNDYPSAAEYLLDKKWEPARALKLAVESKALVVKSRAADKDKDNLSDEQLKSTNENNLTWDQYLDGLILRAAAESGQTEEALKLKPELEAAPPADKRFVSDYWGNRARLEAIEKHTQDALAYYQLALTTRTDPPKAFRGKVTDDLGDEAHALWKTQGGTETAWALWSKPAGGAPASTDGEWEKATKKIPDFELSDMTGKTWKLKELAGKTVVINLWATWCGPCQAELPQLEKFYEAQKGRSDIQILTFDIDEDLGVVEPFVKEKGWTFPVLPAYSTVVSLLDGFAIPQTWLVDTHGVWQWKQIGFSGGSDADFSKEMMDRINAVKGGQ